MEGEAANQMKDFTGLYDGSYHCAAYCWCRCVHSNGMLASVNFLQGSTTRQELNTNLRHHDPKPKNDRNCFLTSRPVVGFGCFIRVRDLTSRGDGMRPSGMLGAPQYYLLVLLELEPLRLDRESLVR